MLYQETLAYCAHTALFTKDNQITAIFSPFFRLGPHTVFTHVYVYLYTRKRIAVAMSKPNGNKQKQL